MKIVLDSNVICADFQLNGRAFRVLIDGLGKTGHSLYVPKLAIDEVTNKFQEELKRCQSVIQKQLKRVRAVTGISMGTPIDDEKLEAEVEAYTRTLHTRLARVEATICDYPEVPHESVVRRALSRKKPFSESGAGYRDALIWETVIGLMEQSGEPVAFISQNRRDFCDGDTLHHDLLVDISDRGLMADRVLFFASVETFVETHMMPALEVLEDIREQLLTGNYRALDLQEALADQLQGWIATMNLEPEDIGFLREFENPSISSLQHVSISDLRDVRRLASGELLLSLVVDVECEFDFFIFKPNYYNLAEEETPFVSDHNWNDHYVAASKVASLSLELSLTFDEESGQITSLDIEENLTNLSDV